MKYINTLGTTNVMPHLSLYLSIICPYFRPIARVYIDSLMTLPATSVCAKMQRKFDLSKLKAYGWRPFWMRIKWAYIIDFVLLLLPNHN